MHNNPYLTKQEQMALELLALEKSYAAVERECGPFDSKSPECDAFPAFITRLKKKTGIIDPKNYREVGDYLLRFSDATGKPTAKQSEIMQRVLGIGPHNPHHFQGLAYWMKCGTADEAREEWVKAIATIGIFATEESTRAVQARIWFATQPRLTNFYLSKKHIEVARLMAKGAKAQSCAHALDLTEKRAQQIIHEVSAAFGARVRGRGVKAKVIAAALLQHDAQEQLENAQKESGESEIEPQIDMSDPLF